MQDLVSRELKLKKAVYKTWNYRLTAEGNYTFGLRPVKITVKKEDELICTIQEKHAALKVFCRLLMNLLQLAPYKVKYRAQKPSLFKASVLFLTPKITGKIGDDVFELRLHNDDICSITRNNVQIARIEKDIITEFEQNKYRIFYSDESDFELCFIFCVLIDAQWYKDDTEWAAFRYEKTLVPVDKYPERARWMP